MRPKIQICTLVIIALFLYSCGGMKSKLPKTLGENYTSYSYVPLDPLPIFQDPGRSCPDCSQGETMKVIDSITSSSLCNPIPYKKIQDALPDQTVRLAIAKYQSDGSLKFGTFSIGGKGERYRVILDYTNVDVTMIPMFKVKVQNPPKGKPDFKLIPAPRFELHAAYKDEYNQLKDEKLNSSKLNKQLESVIKDDQELITIPVYIGVGLRMVAEITTLDAKTSLSGLNAIAIEASAGKIVGSMTVQTLGITGKNVATALPLPSELNQTTLQNAILSLGSIKAQLYDAENTVVTPRVVGIYNSVGGGEETINAVISDLARKPAIWYRPCIKKADSIKK